MKSKWSLGSRAFWLRQMRQWHWISAAICLIGMLLFAATGIMRAAISMTAVAGFRTRSIRAPAGQLQIIASVTVIASSCMKADAFATALSVLEVEEGMRFAGARGIAARFIIRGAGGLVERMTPAFAQMAD
jgi:hypothetical protein